MLSVFYFIAFRSIAFSLPTSDISVGNSLSVLQYIDIPLSYTDGCLLFLCFCGLLEINDDNDDDCDNDDLQFCTCSRCLIYGLFSVICV